MAHERTSSQVDGTRLLQLREAEDLTLRELAERCRKAGKTVSNSQLSKIERGLCQPRPKLLRALAGVYGLTVRDLCKPTGSESEVEAA